MGTGASKTNEIGVGLNPRVRYTDYPVCQCQKGGLFSTESRPSTYLPILLLFVITVCVLCGALPIFREGGGGGGGVQARRLFVCVWAGGQIGQILGPFMIMRGLRILRSRWIWPFLGGGWWWWEGGCHLTRGGGGGGRGGVIWHPLATGLFFPVFRPYLISSTGTN